ncbi:MAG: hypothetical protein WCI73_14690 [Phycisphaerae bacterium]
MTPPHENNDSDPKAPEKVPPLNPLAPARAFTRQTSPFQRLLTAGMLIAATVIVWTKQPPLEATVRYAVALLTVLYIVVAGPRLVRELFRRRRSGPANNQATGRSARRQREKRR